jgi:hypothetical protein
LDSGLSGVLGVSKIDGLEFFDVTSFVTAVSVSRGRSRQLDYYNSGSATINFNNIGREFDPINEDSPYYPGIRPRCLIKITRLDLPIFYGFVNDWDVQYGVVGNDTALASCSDGLMIFSNQILTAFTPSVELSGVRVNVILDRDEVSYVGGRDIDDGTSTLGAYAVDANTNVLNYLRQVERSEQGSLFVASNGDLVFRSKSYFPETLSPTFADDGTGIPYQTLSNEVGDELLYNYIRFKSPAGAEQIKSDTDSITVYQISQLSYDDLLNNSTGVVSTLANFYLNRFKLPKFRLTGFQVQLSALSDVDVEDVLSLDLADYVYVLKSFNSGTPSSLTQFSFVSGISHRITPDSHLVSFSIESSDGTTYLILGSQDFGRLDLGLLDFG